MSRFNENKPITKTVNLAGGAAYKRDAKEELAFACVSTFLTDEFYEKGNDRIDRIVKLAKEVNPQFLAKLAVIARNDFNLRSVSHLLVRELAYLDPSLVREVILKVANRPDDLTEIASSFNDVTKLPSQVRRGIRRSLYKFDEYQLGKYRMEGKKLSLVDLFNLLRPSAAFATEEQRIAWDKLMKGELKAEGTWEKTITESTDKGKSWEELVKDNKLGYMALLRNLRNIEQNCSAEVIQLAADKIRDPEQVMKSKQLPFRFMSALDNVSNSVLVDAISDALEYAVSNAPKLEGKTLIAVDTSSSMMYGNNGRASKIASVFAGALKKQNQADIILYDTRVQEVKLPSGTPALVTAEVIRDKTTGGGTMTSLVFDWAMNKYYDNIIILSDNESWGEGYFNHRDNVQETYREYKSHFPHVKVFAVDIQGYGTSDIKDSNVYHFAGWSEKILDLMGIISKGSSLVEYIETKDL